ncbi:MAG: chorismate mutase [Alphaproteobacteria bacterium]|nr:chorismate mutase [Alphaproteobacteria bacterium]
MATCNSLEEVRENIDRLDRDIVALLVQRSHFVHEAARLKTNVADIVVPARIEQIIGKVRLTAQEMGADPDLMERLYRSLIDGFIWDEGRTWRSLNP